MIADQDQPDLLAILRQYYGDVLDNSPNGDMRYLSDALEELIAARVQAAIKLEREAPEVEAMRMLWDDQHPSEKDHYLGVVRRARSEDREVG